MSGIFLSTNNGSNWASINGNLTNQSVSAIAISGTNIFTGTSLNGIFRSTNNGANWVAVNNGLQLPILINSLVVSGSNVFAGLIGGGVYLSTNNGLNWIQKNQNIGTTNIKTLQIANGYIFAGTSGYSVLRRSLSEIINVKNISSEIPSSYSLGQNYPNPFNPITKIKFTCNGFPVKTSGNDKVGICKTCCMM